MKKNKITFLILECVFLILTLFFAWKIFDRDVPEKTSCGDLTGIRR